MATISKQELSGGTDGAGIKLTDTSSPGTLIHTATSATGSGLYDEIWLWAVNTSGASMKITIQFGGTTAVTNDIIQMVNPSETSLVLPGLVLQNSLVVRAYVESAGDDLVSIQGFVNRIA